MIWSCFIRASAKNSLNISQKIRKTHNGPPLRSLLYLICFNIQYISLANDVKKKTFSMKLYGPVKLFSIDWMASDSMIWARSVTLAIRKLKCWVNAILPIVFIKEMNKLVTLSKKHDQKANLKSAPPRSHLLLTMCLPASCLSSMQCAWVTPHP